MRNEKFVRKLLFLLHSYSKNEIRRVRSRCAKKYGKDNKLKLTHKYHATNFFDKSFRSRNSSNTIEEKFFFFFLLERKRKSQKRVSKRIQQLSVSYIESSR